MRIQAVRKTPSLAHQTTLLLSAFVHLLVTLVTQFFRPLSYEAVGKRIENIVLVFGLIGCLLIYAIILAERL